MSVCMVNVRHLTAAHLTYALDNDDFITLTCEGSSRNGPNRQFNHTIGHRGVAVDGYGAPWGPLWHDKHLPGPEALFCPSNTIYGYTWEAFRQDDTDGTYWFGTPNVASDWYMTIGYGVRPMLTIRGTYDGHKYLPQTSDMQGMRPSSAT